MSKNHSESKKVHLETVEEELHATVTQETFAIQSRFVRYIPHSRPGNFHHLVADVAVDAVLDQQQHCLRAHQTGTDISQFHHILFDC